MRAGLAWSVFGLACVLAVAGGPLTRTTTQDVAIALSFCPLGAYLVARRLGGAVGPLCLVAVLGAVAHAAERYSAYADWIGWLARWVWAPPLLAIGTVLLLLVPEGRLPGRRWRPVAAVAVTGIAAFTVLLAFVPGPERNPYAVEALRPVVWALPIAIGVLALITLSCMAGLGRAAAPRPGADHRPDPVRRARRPPRGGRAAGRAPGHDAGSRGDRGRARRRGHRRDAHAVRPGASRP